MSRFYLSPFLALLGAVALSAAQPAAAAISVQGGIRYVGIQDAAVGEQLSLVNAQGQTAGTGTADTFGSLIFRELTPGNYKVVQAGGVQTPVKVLAFDEKPDNSFYASQTLVNGYQYLKMRDGTMLAAMVRLPAGPGPFPTLIEYSGYSPADPESPQPSTLITSVLGFATVGVNMRGSGCSGGVFDLFDLPTTADGYDIVEIVGNQPWVLNNKVGMVGISFPGITQLFVGGAQPPHLGALAPFSTIADIYRAPGYPGGIANDGFARSWLDERARDGQPAPSGGQGWARKRARNGDQVCIANQKLRLQIQDPVEVTAAYPFYTPSVMDNRSPINWVGKIQVPTFYSAAWQDEQTGPGFVPLLSVFPNRPDVKLTVQNGVHTSPLDPEVMYNWIAFLDLYVAHKVPDPGRVAPIAPIIASQIIANSPAPKLPVDRWDGVTDYNQAKRMFEEMPHVRVLMENGAGSPIPGLPAPTFELGYHRWPADGARKTAWYFGEGGTLTRGRVGRAQSGIDTYRPDPAARPRTTFPSGGDSWALVPNYDWEPLVNGTALAYATEPFTRDTTIVGTGSVDLWLRSSAADTDLQVTLSEIRPDGLETYVQSGWLRASHRFLDRRLSTAINPWPTHLEADAAPMPAGEFTKVRVPLFASAHLFRAGSRLRISIEAPGNDRTIWSFETPATPGTLLNEVAFASGKRSRVVLPVVRNGRAPAALPPCPGLRGQPCRLYVPAANGG